MNYETPELDPAIRREWAVECVRNARAAVAQVTATVAHNASREWVLELERCKKALAEAEEKLAEIDGGINLARKSERV
jgi:hypothetical protein